MKPVHSNLVESPNRYNTVEFHNVLDKIYLVFDFPVSDLGFSLQTIEQRLSQTFNF